MMDRISQLPDALLLRILSTVPAKDVVATRLLSRRWESLWKMVPELQYDDSSHTYEYWRFSRFVDRSLLLNEAPVLESLQLKLGPKCGAVDVGIWVKLAVDRRVSKMTIHYSSTERPIKLPMSLYTCDSLMVLVLNNGILVDVPDLVCFPSLKILHLDFVKYAGDESVLRFLSNCPVLEDLVVKRCHNDNVTTFVVTVPTLQRLYVYRTSEKVQDGDDLTFSINAPSVKHFGITDYHDISSLAENMPVVEEANIDVTYSNTEKLLGSLTSVKCLSLCLNTSKAAYPTGSIFYRLVYLELCTCVSEWMNLLMLLLKDCPNLRVLKLDERHTPDTDEPRPSWNQPSSVPECLLFHLENFEFQRYGGNQEEKELVIYILKNANRLKMASISPKSTDLEEKFRMIKELALSSRGSTECELVFE
ncbi:PREDICTED: F-box/FBD/LRR-repeat protein At5g56420-like [Tarenaya hassleriana]|uniref:F-box/FBD/LRR-repeat protein At5g56420-like n=1 Tax=Tarenaya hassleriana TaxID=28532 RepID=UPI00053C1E3B|nr:PREDICTED: F-box/FBD/LRR-repeat protein At5g56420-like [Tarenaya hassleriana]XP_019058022.1 PREDICTED: F-box/FBD/LRR-repeat protein At5g56420-like [Tarenaya hassleriana]XP_019058023.1 PREDICTED: F-box/FBD/LRR-repeat protein At5g56420-like [Tarenaya hassleriana]XP_019058024.1 PREDICTED: F-box/FBD/LRR-repeat protein At5g56420-like [Tarenaya hassleriana]